MIVSIFVASVLFVIAAVHLVWALGSNWPCSDRESLMRTVVGHPGAQEFPSMGLTMVAALAIAAAGMMALWAGGYVDLPLPHWLLTAGVATLTLIFVGRGASSYTVMRVWAQPCEPFATLDRRNYAPLCVVLGSGFGWLLWHLLQ